MSNNIFHIGEVKQLINQPKNNVSITQNNYANDNQELNKKLDEMFAKLDPKHTQEMRTLANELVRFIDYKINELDKPEIKETPEYQNIKVSNDLKARIKASIPIIPFLVSIDLEKEWKISEDIQPETFMERLREFLHIQNVNPRPLGLED